MKFFLFGQSSFLLINLFLDFSLSPFRRIVTPSFLCVELVDRRALELCNSVLGYANDLALVSSSTAGAQAMFSSLVKTRRFGLQVNATKTEVLVCRNPLLRYSRQKSSSTVLDNCPTTQRGHVDIDHAAWRPSWMQLTHICCIQRSLAGADA